MAEHKHSNAPVGFKEVPGYDGRYFINENGDVWSAFKRDLMSPQISGGKNYPWVLLRENGKSQPRTIHYLMRLTWMPPAPGKVGNRRGQWCINHIDGNKLNSHISNLEWLTCGDNVKHAWANGLNQTAIGELAKNAMFTSDQVRQIRLDIIAGVKAKDLACQYKCKIQAIKKIKSFYSWKHQDHDLIVDLMKVCKSKWLKVMKTKIEKNERIEECCNRLSRGRIKWTEESLALYL